MVGAFRGKWRLPHCGAAWTITRWGYFDARGPTRTAKLNEQFANDCVFNVTRLSG
jgi:hypothetical protein